MVEFPAFATDFVEEAFAAGAEAAAAGEETAAAPEEDIWKG